jgi:hypothetical protein
MPASAHNIAGKPRGATFKDWKAAAVEGYIVGGARPEAAAAVVDAAAENIQALASELTPEFFQTFIASLDLECGRYVRRHGAAFFADHDGRRA